MEINAEINRVFGAEMARLYAAQIPEEEMLSDPKRIWGNIKSETGWWDNRVRTRFEDDVRNALMSKVLVGVEEYTNTDEFKAEAKELGAQMVKDIQIRTYDKVVEEASDRMAGLSLGGSHLGLRGMIEEIVFNSLNR